MEENRENQINDKEEKINLEKDSVLKIFLYYAIPGILGMVAMSSAGIIDGAFVGQLVGTEALAAVNLAMPLLNVFYGIGVMVAVGGATLANIRRGEKNFKEANNFFSVTLSLIAIIGILATAMGVLFSDNIAIMVGAKEDTIQLVSTYVGTVSIFFIGFLGNFTAEVFLKNDGFPVWPIVATVTGAITNVVLDYLFIAEFQMGIAGAALATGISYTVPFLIMMIIIVFKSSWKFVIPHFEFKAIREMLFNGSSELLSFISVGVSGLIFNFIIMRDIGTVGVAAYSVAIYVSTIAMAIYWGIASAIGPGVSFNKGALNRERVEAFKKVGIFASLIFGVILSIVLFTFGGTIVDMFVSNNEEVRSLAITITDFYGIAMIFAGVNVVASMYYTSINQPMISAVIASLRGLIALVIGILVLPIIFGENGIWASIIFAEVVTLIVSLYYFKKKPW